MVTSNVSTNSHAPAHITASALPTEAVHGISGPTSKGLRCIELLTTLETTESPCSHAVAAACTSATEYLAELGFCGVREIRSVWPRDFRAAVPAECWEGCAAALTLLAWYHHRNCEGSLDIAAQYLERAAALTPLDVLSVERFASVATDLTASDIAGLARDPKKQLETVIGYKRRAKDAIEVVQRERFGVDEATLFGERSLPTELPLEDMKVYTRFSDCIRE